MNTKAKGTRLERKTRDALIRDGYRVQRAGASLGEWDLIAIGPLDILLVQVKCGRWPGSAEMSRMTAFPAPFNARKQVWRWDDRAKEPRVKTYGPDGWMEAA